MIDFEGSQCKVYGDECCLFNCFSRNIDHLRIQSVIFAANGKKYRAIGISSNNTYFNGGNAKIISFYEQSEISGVPASLIGSCTSIFILPPRTKRVLCSGPTFFPKIVSDKCNQRFISTIWSHIIMNHFPLEHAYQHSSRNRCFIREFVRFVGDWSFLANQSIKSVVFPSSVEIIGNSSFRECANLQFIGFKKNSRFKTIDNRAFQLTDLTSVDIPSNVERIECFAFSSCSNLKSITFHEVSRLKRIGNFSLFSTAFESVDFPSNVEKIGDHAFFGCRNLKSVKHQGDKKIIRIGKDTFSNCHELLQ